MPEPPDASTATDATAVALLRARDARGFDILYRRYFPRLRRYALVILRDDDEAEDIAQEALLRAVSRLDRFDPSVGAFDTWVFSIARNLALTSRRKRWLAMPQPELPEATCESTAHPAGFAEIIGDLPLAQRQAIFLRYEVGCGSEEIALMLDRSAASVRQLQHRALAKLAQAQYERPPS